MNGKSIVGSPRLHAAALMLLLSGAPGCGSGEGGGQATGAVCPSNSTLTYANFGEAFFADNCLSCHTSRQRPTLTTQAAIQANIDYIDRLAAAGPNSVNTTMPQQGSVSVEQRTLLGEWLACGAP